MLRTVTLLLMFSLAVAAEAAQTVDSAVFMALQNAQAAQEKGEYAAARKALDAVQARPGSLEETLVWRSRGYLAWAAGNNAEALKWLEQAHASGLLDAAAQQAERLNLARLNLAEERYARVVTLLEPLPSGADEAQLKMVVQAYQGLDRLDKALPLAERYVAAQPSADDTWLRFLVGGYARAKRYEDAERWQRRLLVRHPDEAHSWWQLAGLQQMAGQEGKALATLRTARTKGVAFSEQELDNLVLMASAADQPWQGARLLDGLLREGLLATSPARQERLGQLWWQARERPAASRVFRQLAERTNRAGHWMSLAQLELEQARWQAGLDALRLAEKAGADRRLVRDWREWAESELGMAQRPQLAQAR